MTRRPLIGITPTPSTSRFDHGDFYRYCLSDTYVKAVWQGGGAPIILPWVSDTPEEILDEIDGLIISGGGDIDPARFEQERHAKTDGVDDARDRFELALMRAAADRDLPTLAICRGIQVMTVAFGGSLHQHVPDVASGVEHRQQTAGRTQHEPSHRVTLENLPNPIGELVGTTELSVNSFHHQAPADLPEPLRVAGRADDGVIEAIWHPGMTFGVGVQWHPEMLAASFPEHAAFFRALVESAKAPASV
jgi:putative glutamine amidotransferase